MSSPIDTVSNYFLAKDGNRPRLMRRVFTEDAELEIVVMTDAISFPESARGIDAIEDILVRRFADEYENIYTFGLTRPTATNRHHFPCHWLVGMSVKKDGQVRVGCGQYDWYFTPDDRCLAERLAITIDVMCVFPGTELDCLMTWLSSLPYPWCTPLEAVSTLPNIDGLTEVEQHLRKTRTNSLG